MESMGMVFNVQKYSTHDGPGIRTTIFLKGCPLRCLWCANPESQNAYPQVAYDARLCRGCLACVGGCEGKALEWRDTGIVHDLVKCRYCGACADNCVYGARVCWGREESVDALVKTCEEDMPFYRKSGGGVTISGGEPFIQSKFTNALVRALRVRNIHTAVETTGYASREEIMDCETDLFLYDFKCFDEETHLRLTGVGNVRIKENLSALLRAKRSVIVRMPLMPGLNMTDALMDATGTFLAKIGARDVHLIPYHDMGVGKYRLFDREYTLEDMRAPTEEELRRAEMILSGYGLTVGRS